MTLFFVLQVIGVNTAYVVWNSTHFLEKTFRHVDGSACCSNLVNREPSPTSEICAMRCSNSQVCSAWVYQPSTGACWIGNHEGSPGLVIVPQLDRIAGVTQPTLIRREILKHRADMGPLLNQLQPGGLGIILGVGHASFSAQLMSTWTGGVYLVDPYIHIYQGYDDPANVDDKTHQFIYEHVRSELHRRFESKHVMIRDFSKSFADTWTKKEMPNPTFIYVDNNHSETAVTKDLDSWWDLLAPGGIMAGNMYLDDKKNAIGVKKAVDSWFGQRRSIPIYCINDMNEVPNWLVFKPYA